MTARMGLGASEGKFPSLTSKTFVFVVTNTSSVTNPVPRAIVGTGVHKQRAVCPLEVVVAEASAVVAYAIV